MKDERQSALTEAEVAEKIQQRKHRERRELVQTVGGIIIAIAALGYVFLNGADSLSQASVGFIVALVGAGIVHPDKIKDLWPG